ncbi:membrane dipeptidase [Altererythrobacter salegens]|uniref:Membrane dipeptidase n=1 Tax=Croceibacterium salegens TaxID=1737568 RepID=A0A6I4T122_9SPHN|nr:dipeptidase [Croceibacterium salegens]MXO60362.1 membrane dipeptidase [Croceibacterium salegens]
MTRYRAAIAASLFALAGCSATSTPPAEDAASLHRDLLVLDTHLDTPINFGRPGWDFAAAHTHENDIAQVDLGRMAAGNLDGGFFVVFTAQGPLTAKGYADALAFARQRSDTIDKEIAAHPAMILPALGADDAEKLNAEHKLIAFKSMENSYPLGEDLTLLKEFYDRGVRMAGPVHSTTNQFADSAEDAGKWNGLSPLGRQWVAEMNRLGIVIDGSHSSDAAFDQLLEFSKTPIILSHTSPRAAFDHPRNLDDARIRKLAAKGGAICVSTIYLSPINLAGKRGELFEKYENITKLSPAEQAELARATRELDKTDPIWATSFEHYMAAVLHTIEVAGVDHVCFGADWDGGGGIAGMEDITALPKVTERLLEAGYSREDIGKMTGGNVLRIMRAAAAAKQH